MRVSVGPPHATLHVWIGAPSAGPRGTVLVLHGIRDRKHSMIGTGRRLVRAGFRAVLVDLRGHGCSTGDYLTYGAREGRDLVQVLDALPDVRSVGVFGPSYGGAAALQLSARDQRVDAVVTASTFTSMRGVVTHYTERYAGIFSGLVPEDWVRNRLEQAARRAGFASADADSTVAIARTEAPVLLLHGEKDDKIPFDHGRALRRAASIRAQLVPIAGADHASMTGAHGDIVAERMLAWFERWLSP